MSLSSSFMVTLEMAINRCLRLDPGVGQGLAAFGGKVIALRVRGIHLSLYLAPHGGGLQLLQDYAGVPDAEIAGTPVALARLMVGDRSQLLFKGEVEISGDAELAQRFASVLQTLEIDWEECFSQLVGDIIAHQAGNWIRGAWAWSRDSMETLSRDAVEYLQYESDYLPDKREVERFVAEVDTLRDDVDRLEAWIQHLCTRSSSPPGNG